MAPRRTVEPVPLDETAVSSLLDVGRNAGLDAVGITSAEPLLRARQALADRVAREFDGGLPFTYRNPERSTTPGHAVRQARSILVGARSYLFAESDAHGPDLARVARYAWMDHYAPLRAALRTMASELKRAGWRAVVFADDNSVVDREVAWRAGIGWYGKNANLLLPRAGSWFVLGCLITDAELPVAQAPVADGCGSCRKCFDGCPTGAIVEPGVIDARRCLAWLLQRPGIFPVEFREALGDRLYGCDDCQDVCPPNLRFATARSDRASAESSLQQRANVLDLLDAADDQLIDSFGRWYLHQREPRWLRRNALVILGNIGRANDQRTRRLLADYVAHGDPMLRAHAVWALRRLGIEDLLPAADDDRDVQTELSRSLEVAR